MRNPFRRPRAETVIARNMGNRKLLGKAPVRHDDRTLHLKDYLTPVRAADWAAAPAPLKLPVRRTWNSAVPTMDWGVLGNDQYGDCVEAGMYHLLQMWEANADNPGAAAPTTADVLALYSELTGFDPADPSTDNGTEVLSALNYWRNTGVPWTLQDGTVTRHKILGYAKVDPTSVAEVKTAANEFGGLLVGARMPLLAEDEFDSGHGWTAATRVGRGAVGSWGGHCMPLSGFGPTSVPLITWGRLQWASWAWMQEYCDEAYAVIAPEWVGPGGLTPSGVDLVRLKADILALR